MRLAGVLCALVLSGCGLGAGEKRTGADVLITRDFGTTTIREEHFEDIPSGDTVMRVLQREFDVTTRYGGGFVQSLEGLEGGSDDGRRQDWFFYLNGIESEEGSAAVDVSEGDVVWWDHHDWSTTMRIPAVVGSFPAPFLSAPGGKRFPQRLDCAPTADAVCDEVAERLAAADVTRIGRGALNQSAGVEVIRVIVGTWEEVRADAAVSQLEDGPQQSGVFARFADDGLELLDPDGEVVRTVESGGLVAATRLEDQQPTWIVTGSDAAGLEAAAAALTEDALGGRFAVAVEDGRPVPLPIVTVRDEPEAVE